MPDLYAQITARIAELEKEREGFVAQANLQLAAYNAAIGELKKLLAPEEPVEVLAEVGVNGKVSA